MRPGSMRLKLELLVFQKNNQWLFNYDRRLVLVLQLTFRSQRTSLRLRPALSALRSRPPYQSRRLGHDADRLRQRGVHGLSSSFDPGNSSRIRRIPFVADMEKEPPW